MNASTKQLIRTAREFVNVDDMEVERIAAVRTKREKNSPYNHEYDYNLYVKEFGGLSEFGELQFHWVNYGTFSRK